MNIAKDNRSFKLSPSQVAQLEAMQAQQRSPQQAPSTTLDTLARASAGSACVSNAGPLDFIVLSADPYWDPSKAC